MAVVVSFATVAGIGSVHAPGIGDIRAMEVLDTDGTTTTSAEGGEVVLVTNAGDDPVLVAFGSTPDGQATARTSATSAGLAVVAGACAVLAAVSGGDKINVKAVE